MVLAHGIGGRSDLPVPFYLALYGAGIAVALSFALLALLWPHPRLRGAEAGRPLPSWLVAVIESTVVRTVLRTLVLVVSALVVAVAVAGPEDAGSNIAPYALYITFWVGLVPMSVLFGPVWRVVNPLRWIHAGFTRLTGGEPEVGLRPLPESIGWWPAVGWLGIFVWLELVFPDRAEPTTVAAFLVGYAVLNLVAALVYGSGWFDRGDGFEAYSTLFGHLSPLGRRSDGRLVLRNPLDGLSALEPGPGLVGLVVVIVGSTAFDGVTRTRFWTDNIEPDDTPIGTLGLLATIALVGVMYLVASRLVAVAGRDGVASEMPGRFVHSVVPIAIGYTIAHYFSLFLFTGQMTYILASDPFATGANWFGTADNNVDYTVVSPQTIAVVQVAAIVTGHVIGVVAAHDRAVAMFRGQAATRSQYPLVAVMIAFTLGGVALLLGA